MSTTATRTRPRPIAAAAATATLLNRQKPIALSRSAWWPGGRTRAKAVSPVSSACSAAWTAAPAASRAISTDSGEVNVSASSIAARPFTASIASTWAASCTRRISIRVAGRGSATRPPRSRHSAAMRSNTSARSGRSGWPGGGVCSWNRGDEIKSMSFRSVRTAQDLRFQFAEHPLELDAFRFDGPVGGIRHMDRLADGNADGAERLRHLRPVPALHRPEAIGLDVKRQQRLAGCAGQEHRPCLRHARRAARAVDGEGGRTAAGEIAPQLHQGPRAAARRRAARRAVAEPADDAGNPLAVEVLAGDDDDAAVFPEERGGQDAPVPEREDRLLTRGDDGFVVREPVDLPAIGRSERTNERSGCRRNQRSFATLAGRQT